MLDDLVSSIACVSINHQNQLEQMANTSMFAIRFSQSLLFGPGTDGHISSGSMQLVLRMGMKGPFSSNVRYGFCSHQ
jgi:hypothetical protein